VAAEQDRAAVTSSTRIIGIAAIAALTACKIDSSGDERPARIVAPTSASRAELERAVSAALDGVAVQLADDALVQDSVLIIEPRAYRDAQNNRIMGRDPGVPTQFRLLKHGDQCILERTDTHGRWVLSDTTCEAE
jgi:hypothetical protein